MFQHACSTIREAVYGIKCLTTIGGKEADFSTGTGFMIAPGVLATAAHVMHLEGDVNKSLHQSIEVIRAPDIGQVTERAQFMTEDVDKDVAFLRLEKPRSNRSIVLEPNILNIGTSCGSLGFPLSFINPQGGFNLVLRFQGAFISCFNLETLPSGKTIEHYETDSLMYSGSSRCPGFTVAGRVFGMHNKARTNIPQAIPQQMPKSLKERRQQMRGQQQQAAKALQPSQTDRFAISLWVPSTHIVTLARANGISI